IDETDCYPEDEIRFTERLLYDNSSSRPPEEFVSENSDADIKSFSPSPILDEDSDSHMEEIDLPFNPDDPIPPSIEDDDYNSERDILIPEEFPSNYSLSLPVNESFHFDIPVFSHPSAKPPDGNTRILNIKMMGDVSNQKVPMPKLMITLASNQEKSPDLLSHRGLKICKLSAKCPMMIHGKNIPTLDVPLFHFYPLDQLNSKFKDSRCYDDDDDGSAITPNEPVDSLSMGDKHIDTIPATESDELIKSCVENLVPNPSESQGKNGCDLLACFTTFSNILFDAEYESDSSDYQSCSDEDFPKEIFSNPL
nr:hypothetical protein [Tanacetum cinerariifolium]